ncbi:MAG: hypothetical protein EPO40_18365 [Myxococcaceae bacterium]|nr:MAG: hypothetical protein EPO40_18365 [Myxococcaceae bacterium]
MFWIKLGLVLHTIAAGALTGSATHLALTLRKARRGRPNPRLQRLYPAVAAGCYLAVYVLGTLIYPRYRVEVRANWLDDHAPWASVLFDLKENLATLLGPLVLAMVVLSRAEEPAKPSRALLGCAAAVALGVWFNVVSGLLVGSMRSV